MTYINNFKDSINIGDRVILTKDIECMAGKMLKGTEVTIIDWEQMRGYSFKDDEGNRIIEAGHTGFEKIKTEMKKMTAYEIYWNDLNVEAQERLKNLKDNNSELIPLSIIEIEED